MAKSKGIKGRGFRFDLTGQQFGRLTVVAFSHVTDKHHAMWECVCACGKQHIAMGNRLKSGKTQSCGCLQISLTKARSRRHGMSGSAEYQIYACMLSRCSNPNVRSYPRYGGRGVGVCDRWRLGDGEMSGFECFFADVGSRPSMKHSLEREDNDIGYTPRNVRWATHETQANNTSRNRVINIADHFLTVAQACRHFGARYSLVSRRLHHGWSEEAAVLSPRGVSELEFLRQSPCWGSADEAAYLSPQRRLLERITVVA